MTVSLKRSLRTHIIACKHTSRGSDWVILISIILHWVQIHSITITHGCQRHSHITKNTIQNTAAQLKIRSSRRCKLASWKEENGEWGIEKDNMCMGWGVSSLAPISQPPNNQELQPTVTLNQFSSSHVSVTNGQEISKPIDATCSALTWVQYTTIGPMLYALITFFTAWECLIMTQVFSFTSFSRTR